MSETAVALKRHLEEALAALATGGDPVEAERRAKAVSALVKAEREVAELIAAAPPSAEDDEEARRAELRRRIAVFVDASRAGMPDEVLQRIADKGSAQ
jgi:hypothetical protein